MGEEGGRWGEGVESKSYACVAHIHTSSRLTISRSSGSICAIRRARDLRWSHTLNVAGCTAGGYTCHLTRVTFTPLLVRRY